MITFILGDIGHGKSTKIINSIFEDVKNGQKSILIVPEQETLFCERIIASPPFEPSAQRFAEVLSFSRLANKFFRMYGGLRYNYATRSDKNLVMYRAICEARDLLKYYKNISKGREHTCVKLFLDAIGELKAYGVTADRLKEIMSELGGSLRERLGDLLTIWTIYERILYSGFDDTYDDIINLASRLNDEKIDFLKDYNVYIDSFYGFTQTQLDVIRQIVKRAKNVTFAFDCPADERKKSIQYTKITTSMNIISSFCDTMPEIIPCNDDFKHENETIKYLADNIWNFSAEPIKQHSGVTLALASDEFEECEYVASKIKSLIIDGCRYSDIAIVMRDAEKYRGLIDYALKKFEIPYFLSTSVDVMTLPAIKMIFCALRAISTYRPEDVISYVKCSYLDLSESELNEFESYIFKWNIYGKRFKDPDYWVANPDGYVKKMTEAQKNALSLVHSARDKVLKSLLILEDAFIKKEPIDKCAKAIFNFLKEHGVKGKIQDELKKCTKQEAYELSQIWNVLLRSLDTLSSVCAGAVVSPDDLSVLLMYALSDTEINTIPSGNDVVVIGDARTIRAKDIKHTFILNVNEGIFPASVHDDGFFSDADKIALEGQYIDLSSKSDTRAIDELINFRNAIGSASKTVTISCLKTDILGTKLQPSNAFLRIKELLQLEPTNIAELPLIDKIYTRQGALEYLTHSGTALGIAVKEYFNADDKRASDGFVNNNISINDEVAKNLVGSHLSLSKSSIESFASCKFKYYCSFVLGLNSSKKISFASNDVGNLAHYVLEKFLKLRDEKKIDISMLKDAELKEIVDDIVESYIALICYSTNVSKRLRFLFNKLKKNLIVYLKNLINELVQSDFKDEYHELDMSGDGINTPTSISFKLSNGITVSLNGVADRIDVYRKGDTAFVRVVDYKSGSDETNIENIETGFGIQLFLYLLTICKLEKCDFRDKLLMGADKLTGVNKIAPAGVMYFPMNMDKKNIGRDVDFENSNINDIESTAINEKISRSGYFLDDSDVINAQDKKQDGTILPKKDENEEAYIPKTKFDEIFDTIKDTIERIGNDILSGDASAVPVANPNKSNSSPCTYCEFRAICRSYKKGVKD